MEIAVGTCAALPEGHEYDRPVLGALERAGAAVALEVWDDPAVDWHRYDAVVVRWPWDYTRRREAFVAWAEAVGPRLHNAPALLRWNSDKRYLADLAAARLPVVPTTLVEPGDPLPDLGCREVVVKPTVSAGSRDTGRFGPAAHAGALALLERLAGDGRTAMVQPYLPAVEQRGETAIVMFAGRESHVLRKRAILAPDEVAPLVEGELGTAVAMWDPELVGPGDASSAERALATAVIDHVTERFGGEPPLYARVDMLAGEEGLPVLLELEAIEPSLYLNAVPGAAERLAKAVVARAGA